MPIAPRGHAEAERRCRELAAAAWSDSITAQWPVVLAYEHWRLRHELEQGRAYAAMMQMKDLAEVLVKLPAIVAARLLIECGNEAQAQEARATLVAPQPLTLGHWVGRGRRLSAAARLLPAAAPWAGVLGLLVRENGKASRLAQWIEQQVIPWRNEELAHGALKLDLEECTSDYAQKLRPLLERLNEQELAFARLRLIPAGHPDLPLTGFEAMDDPAPLEALFAERPLLPLALTDGRTTLDFGAYLCVKRGDRSERAHCFLLNKRLKTARVHGLHLLDYQFGEVTRTEPSEAGEALARDLDAVPWPTEEDQALHAGRDTLDEAVRRFLDKVSFRNEYIPPEFLREWLRDFVTDASRERGIAWLRGPADVGKTLFALGLDTQEHGVGEAVLAEAMPPRLAPEVEVIVVPLRREYRCTPLSLGWQVQVALARAEDRQALSISGYLNRDEHRGDPPGAFVAWLEIIHREAAARLGADRKLLLVIDALDEIPPREQGTEGGSIVDLLPPAEQLPPGVYLLLTSRDAGPGQAEADRCPALVFEQARAALDRSAPVLRTEYALVPEASGPYRGVLKRFFEDQVRDRYADAAERAAAFEQALAAAEHRFKQLSYFAGLLADGAVKLQDLPELQQRGLAAHLEALERHEPARRFALTRAILLELAAAEEAYRAEVQMMEPSPVGLEPQWLGLDLLELARRAGFPSDGARSLDPHFVAALYSVGELLRSYRGDARDRSRFALGLKGMLEQLRQIEGWSTAPSLWRNFGVALHDFNAAQDTGGRCTALLQAAGPALALAAQGHRGLLDPESAEALDGAIARIAGEIAESELNFASAIRLCGLAIGAWLLAQSAVRHRGTRSRFGFLGEATTA